MSNPSQGLIPASVIIHVLNEKLNQVEYMFRRKRKNGG
jgi:hypothetical protein